MRKNTPFPCAAKIVLFFCLSFPASLIGPVSAQENSAQFFYHASRLECSQAKPYLGEIPDQKVYYFALLEQGKCYQQKGDYTESLAYLKKAFSANQAFDAAPYLLAYSFFMLGDFANAKNWIRLAREKQGVNFQRSDLLLTLVNAGIASSPSRETGGERGGDSFIALTERGKKVTFTNVKAGRIILKPEEEIKISSESYELPGADLAETSAINLRIGEFFGFGFVVPDIDFGDAVTIEYEFEFPSSKPDQGEANISKDQETYFQIFSRSTQYIYSFSPPENPGENPAEEKCIQRLFSNGKLLVSHEFLLKK
ncbi:MAG: hypothetical protein NT009_09135 [Proteobacteria bacterium]|nr:hypothetical protein [Pseudomonadota bacterium]